jgi:hypothetical protein
MTQGNFDFSSGDFNPVEEFFPDWLANSYFTPQELRNSKQRLLAILRESSCPRTKKDLAVAMYPRAFNDNYRERRRYWDGYKWQDSAAISEPHYIEKTATIIRSIDAGIRSVLSQLATYEEKVNYLRQAQLIIRVGEDENQAALYAYHGPDRPQERQALQEYCEWAQTHSYKQSKPLELAELIEASASPIEEYGPLFSGQIGQIDTSLDTPDDEMDILEDNEDIDGLEGVS